MFLSLQTIFLEQYTYEILLLRKASPPNANIIQRVQSTLSYVTLQLRPNFFCVPTAFGTEL